MTAEPTAQELAEARERDRKAVQLALAGAGYEEIAGQLGYADRSGAWKAVRRALSRHEAGDVQALREQEVARLDRLQAAVWTQALRGDLQAVTAVLRLIDRRCRLQGLDAPQQLHVSGQLDLADPDARRRELAEVQDELRVLRDRKAAG